MKKIYMTPELEEIKINNNMNLLSVSGGGAADDIGWGGDGSGVEPGAPELPELPGMPSITPNGLLGFPF